MVKKIEICAETRDKCSNGDFIICARTDARGVEGIDWTIKRSLAYIDAGADMIFPEGLENLNEFEFVAKELRKHKPEVFLLANMTEFGKTPLINFKEFECIGYSCVIYPVTLLRVAMHAVTQALETLRTSGSAEPLLSSMQTRQQLYDLVGYKPGVPWEVRV